MKTTVTLFSLLIGFLLSSCNSNQFDKETLSTAADTQSISGLSGDSVKLMKKAEISFKVRDVRHTMKDIVRTARSMDGLVTSRKVESVENNSKRLKISDDSLQVITSYVVKAQLKVRVPSSQMDDFIERVADSALFIDHIDIETEDKSLAYLASQKKQDNAKRLLDATNKSGQASDAAALLKSQNEAVDENIAAKKMIADQKYSTIQLDFFQNALIKKETLADNNLSVYTLPFTTNMKNAFFSGWKYFVNFIVGVTHLWVFILAGLAITTLYKYFKKRSATPTQ